MRRRFSDVAKFWGSLEGGRRVVGGGVGGVWGGRGEEGGRGRQVRVGLGELRVVRLLAPQSGALRISAYRDFHPIPTQSHPNPLIAFEHLSLSMVI